VSTDLLDATSELLARSLEAWGFGGQVERVGDAIAVASGGKAIRVERAPARAPLRWMVTIDGRQRGALALPAVLRQVRGALDPGYARNFARIAPTPLVPS
jgi:hypothetical protein